MSPAWHKQRKKSCWLIAQFNSVINIRALFRVVENNGKILLFASRFFVLVKFLLKGGKSYRKIFRFFFCRKDNTITWHGWRSQCDSWFGITFFVHFFITNRREKWNPFMRNVPAKDAWGKTFWITFYLSSFVQWENLLFLILKLFLHLFDKKHFSMKKMLVNGHQGFSLHCQHFPRNHENSFHIQFIIFHPFFLEKIQIIHSQFSTYLSQLICCFISHSWQ